ncbi:Lanthionine synthetase C-like protein [Streptomyces sp. TLI_053]|uniref:lanthionine synthetase LanC family protein n=1 Tax=Streptomyces sp. TLI_053 TaxID=1855352 RepID=UPI00087C89D1|nr:lanthionine synthetase LanC family protein [Streptomyces sp. TLI_053]SDT83403.1 Lanthionine synthetase C-like protein [Streptomyces sp. TLI_053]
MPDPCLLVEETVAAALDPDQVTANLTPGAAATLADGLPGTALLLAVLADGDTTLIDAADRHWDAAASLVAGSRPDGIYAGPGALAASLVHGSAHLPADRRRHEALGRAAAWLSARAQGLAEHQATRKRAGRPGTLWGIYDTIKGLAGIGRTLLAALQLGLPEAAPGLTAALTTLTGMITTTGDAGRPGWWVAADDHTLTVPGTLPPSGTAGTGAAHGIAGPLTLLALAHQAGVSVPDQEEAIATGAHWLLSRAAPGPSWPPYVSGDDLARPPTGDLLAAAAGRRDAWCYGAPGIAAALHHSGRALADPTLTAAARRALDALVRRAPATWDTSGPGLCHGSAGILQAATRLDHAPLADTAARHTTIAFHEAAPVTGFLTGRAGAALALAAHRQPTSRQGPWDGLLMLA